ncbi:MAG: hypothetical protein ACE5FL_09770 [Myxococcota bacterium]
MACSGRDPAAGWRALLALRGPDLGAPVEIARAPFGDAVLVGHLANPKLEETSGLAASRRRNDLLWAINDGARIPRLIAVGVDGKDLGMVRIEGAEAVDWEALASFEWQGRPHLVVADTGDNFSWRRSVELIVVEEPELAGDHFPPDSRIDVAWRVPFRFEDGPRDCEAVAVAIDADGPRALLLSKRTQPPVLYELPLLPKEHSATSENGPVPLRMATRLGEVPGIPPPTRADVDALDWLGRYAAMPTGLDLSADGGLAAILTYRDAYAFARAPGESWAAALARTPQRIALPPMAQAEAIAFTRTGRTLFATSEKRPSPLYRLEWRSTSVRSGRSRSLR